MPLAAAACGEMALSKAKGPSRTAPVIWPRSAILHSAAASSEWRKQVLYIVVGIGLDAGDFEQSQSKIF